MADFNEVKAENITAKLIGVRFFSHMYLINTLYIYICNRSFIKYMKMLPAYLPPRVVRPQMGGSDFRVQATGPRGCGCAERVCALDVRGGG